MRSSSRKKILELDPNNPNNHIDVGMLNTRLGRNQAAIASYLEAIRLGDKCDCRFLRFFVVAVAARFFVRARMAQLNAIQSA
jgi:regulator of sirC expression with transglutaminase-like and TPR domain